MILVLKNRMNHNWLSLQESELLLTSQETSLESETDLIDKYISLIQQTDSYEDLFLQATVRKLIGLLDMRKPQLAED